jgi:hypothetical protein
MVTWISHDDATVCQRMTRPWWMIRARVQDVQIGARIPVIGDEVGRGVLFGAWKAEEGQVLNTCRRGGVHFSVTAKMDPKIKQAIATIPETKTRLNVTAELDTVIPPALRAPSVR